MKMATFVWILSFVTAALGVYQLKFKVIEQANHLASLKSEIKREREALVVLNAEWALKTSPERLERLNRDFIKLEPIKTSQIIEIDNIPISPSNSEPAEHGESGQNARLVSYNRGLGENN